MWTLITSDGRLLANIGSEQEARHTVHTLGITQLRGPFSAMWSTTTVVGSSLRSSIDQG